MENEPTLVPMRLGVALSGGGHRAAVWGAGALLGLVDAGVAPSVVSISSVSGGSITNGVVAASGDFSGASRVTVSKWLEKGLSVWAHEGMFFPGPPTDRWVSQALGGFAVAVGAILAALGAAVAAGRDLEVSTVAWVALALAAATFAGAVTLAATLPVRPLWLVTGSVTTWPLCFAAIAAASASGWWALLIVPCAVGLVAVAVRGFGSRSEVVEGALARSLFAERTLASLADRPVHHVWCATALQTGNNLYITNRLLWGYPNVAANTGSLSLATAVQCSACLPGAFLARSVELPNGATAVLSDGGVYDNMADQWEWGFKNRQEAAERLGHGALLAGAQPDGATHLVVVNASRGMTGVNDAAISPGVIGELRSALGAKDVLYDVSTATRRRLLIDTFDAADGGEGLGGMLVHIGTSPYQVIDRFVDDDDRGARAREARELLDALTDARLGKAGTDEDRREHWREVAAANSAVRTTLAPLESLRPGNSASLLWHAWVLTRVSAFVLHDWGTIPKTSDPSALDDWREARFDALVQDSKETS